MRITSHQEKPFFPPKSVQNSSCFCLVLQSCIVRHLKPLLFQVWWACIFFCGWLFLCCFYIQTASIILDCPGLVDVMLMPMQCSVFNVLFGNGALICTGHLLGRYQTRTDRPALRTEQLKSLSKDLPQVTAAQ